jgi:ubiquinone/menaquinone biosynthesis C-methylase UbiE
MDKQQHVCPWWLGYTFILPIRKYQHNPQKILAPYVKSGMNVMDYGCAMGYFSIPLAKMTGKQGKVYCVDIQDKMLANLKRRAHKFEVSDIIRPLKVGADYKPENLKEALDFVLLFAVVHEVPNQANLFSEVYSMLKPGGKVLFAEPKGHVSLEDFRKSISLAKNTGLLETNEKPMPKGLSVVLTK